MIKADLSDDSSAADKPQSARFAQKREQIVQTAARKFNLLGVRGATLEDIARDVGIKPHQHPSLFPPQGRSGRRVFPAFHRGACRAIRARAREGVDRETRVRRLVHEYFDMRRDIRTGTGPEVMIFGDMRALNDQHATDVWPRYTELFRTVRTIIRTADDKAEDRALISARAHFLMSQLIRSVFWLPYYPDEALDRVERMFIDILLNLALQRPVRTCTNGRRNNPSSCPGRVRGKASCWPRRG